MTVRTIVMAMCVTAAASASAAQPLEPPAIFFTDALCAGLFEVRSIAESQGRIDLSIAVERTGVGAEEQLIPHVEMGSPYSVGRISFTGHTAISDSTLRRAMTLRERDLLDVGELRRSLARLNDIGFAAPVTLTDLVISRNTDEATADITIPFRERGRRWWSLSGPIIPGLGSYDASISSRLPPWGRGVLDASTYVVSINLLAAAKPLLRLVPFLSKAPPALVALERPYVPGQGWLSGFAVAPGLSPRSTVSLYGRTHVGRAVHALFDVDTTDPLALPVISGDGTAGKILVCSPPKPRWAWLRRGVVHAIDLALAAVLP